MYSDHMFQNKDNKAVRGLWSGSALVSQLANLSWKAFQAINRRLPEGELPTPKWAPGKMLKSHERSAPTLGFPRSTDSLCPKCVPKCGVRLSEEKQKFHHWSTKTQEKSKLKLSKKVGVS